MNQVPLYVVDAFTATPFRGNPASVCLLEHELPDATLRSIAAEMKHSETAFALPLNGLAASATAFSLRWFTPEVEVPLCGHATLATSAVILHELANPARRIDFETMSGRLSAQRDTAGIALDFPAQDFHAAAVSSDVLAALGVRDAVGTFRARRDRNVLIHLPHEADVRELKPDIPALKAAGESESFLGVIVTAAASGRYDFVSRYFAPWVGVDEDPVTGAAHCVLAPYWAKITGKQEMRAYQASVRGGEMALRVGAGRVVLVGAAVVVAAGKLRL